MGESTMSQASEMSTATGDAPPGGEGGSSNMPLIVVALVVLLGIGGAVYFLAFADKGTGDEPEDADQPSIGGNGNGGPSAPAAPPSAPAARPTSSTAESDSTDASHAESSHAEPSHAAASPTAAITHGPPQNVTLKMLACTYGKQGVAEDMVPPDGLCDIIFYTDVNFQSQLNKIEPIDSDLAFNVLKAKAAEYQKTTFGTSMYIGGAIGGATSSKKTALVNAMGELFKEKMVHFGMLNVDKIEDIDKLETGALKYLDVVKEFLQDKHPPPMYHCALGIGLADGSKKDVILDNAVKVTNKFTGITMLVIKVHTEFVNEPSELIPVGPNPDGYFLSSKKILSFAAIKDGIKGRFEEISNTGSQNVRYCLLSFAMYARAYRMKGSWSDEGDRSQAESSLKMDYSVVCKKVSKPDPPDVGSMYAATPANRFLAIFDTPDTFEEKTQLRLKRRLPKNATGMMAYHVEMDDYSNACGEGKFVRLQTIRDELFGAPP